MSSFLQFPGALLDPRLQQAIPIAQGAPQAQPAPSPIPKAQVPIPANAPKDPTAQQPVTPSPMPKALSPESQADQQRLHTLETSPPGVAQIHNPFLRGLGRAADIVGSIAAPRIAQYIPGTTAHHNLLVGQEAAIANRDQAADEANARVGLQQAQAENLKGEAPLHEAQVEETRAKTQQLLHPTVKQVANDVEAWLNDPKNQGKPFSDFWKEKYESENAAKPLKEPTNQTEFWISKNPNGTPEQLKAFLAKDPAAKELNAEDQAIIRAVGGDPSVPVGSQPLDIINKYLAKKKEPGPERPPQAMMLVPGENGQMTATVVRPGSTVAPGAVTPTQAGSINTPTTQQRNVGAQAALVHEQIPGLISEIDRLKEKMGPISGRWNEFMQGKIGLDDPDFAGLRTDLLMASSAVALMHARGRLPENLREEFDNAINAPKQNPENLKAVLRHVDQWTAANMRAMGNQQGSQAAPATVRPTATNANGNKVEWDGKAWVPKR